MKRAHEHLDDMMAVPTVRPVRLNVGGVFIETTKESLSSFKYFAPFLEGSIGYAIVGGTCIEQ